jgi:hypothetical protein
MIAEVGLVTAFFIGLLVGYITRPRKPRTYEIREF